MIKNINLFLCFIFAFFLSPEKHVFAQNKIISLPEIVFEIQPSPTKEDYEVVLQTWTRKTTDLFNKKIWEEIVMKDKKNNIQKKFKNLPSIEQDAIIITTSEKYAQFLSFLAKAWVDELAKFDNPNYNPNPKAKIENEKQEPAKKSDVIAYQGILFDIRKNFAFEQEKFIEEFFNKNKDIFLENEKEQTLQMLRSWNDQESLYKKRNDDIMLLKQKGNRWLM